MTKFRMGLFENPRFPDPFGAKTVIGCKDHRDTALECARESIVLLKNNDDFLPVDAKDMKRVAVIGPCADDILAQLGDWSLGSGQTQVGTHPRESVVTVVDGIKKYVGSQNVQYVRGCTITDDEDLQLQEAVRASEACDFTVLALGDHLPFIGELKSTATLELMGGQKQLLEAVLSTGKPVVLVLINSKPLVLPSSAFKARAIVTAFNPGMPGGEAIADIVFGKVNPSGKLTISWPAHGGQMPLYYNNVPGQHGKDYADLSSDPMFPFGHGLSYSKFVFSNLTCSRDQFGSDDDLEINVDIKNYSERVGAEVVQVYITDLYTSVTWPRKTLGRYKKVFLQPGTTETVSFKLSARDFALCDSASKWVVEPGEFLIRVGASSADDNLLEKKVIYR